MAHYVVLIALPVFLCPNIPCRCRFLDKEAKLSCPVNKVICTLLSSDRDLNFLEWLQRRQRTGLSGQFVSSRWYHYFR